MSYVYHTVNESVFLDAFRAYGRFSSYGYDAIKALFLILDEVARETGQPVEMDVIALCCEWKIFHCAQSAAREYGYDGIDDAAAMEWLGTRTTVRHFRGGVLVQSF